MAGGGSGAGAVVDWVNDVLLGTLGAIAQFFSIIARAIIVIAKILTRIIIRAIKIMVRFAIHAALAVARAGIRHWARGSDSMLADLILLRHFDWKRALISKESADEELERIRKELADNDANGIPDLYDAEVNTPAQDFLHIKYPIEPLRQNDYVRYAPRLVTMSPQPLQVGSKGLVRSEELLSGLAGPHSGGQFVTVKWNRGHIRTAVNALDLYKIGHVHNSLRA